MRMRDVHCILHIMYAGLSRERNGKAQANREVGTIRYRKMAVGAGLYQVGRGITGIRRSAPCQTCQLAECFAGKRPRHPRKPHCRCKPYQLQKGKDTA